MLQGHLPRSLVKDTQDVSPCFGNCRSDETRRQKGPVDIIRPAPEIITGHESRDSVAPTFSHVNGFVAALRLEEEDQQQITDGHGCRHIGREL